MGGKPEPALKAVWRISHGIHNAQQRSPDAHHGPRDFQLTPDKAEKSVEVALERLGLAYADLMILHQPARDYLSGYRQLEKAYKEGKLRAIGLSNFSIECWFPNLLQPIASKLHLVREIPGHEKILSFRARKRKDFSMIPKKFKHLDFDDRKTISNCISQGLTEAETARRIGVSPSTVGREVERHAHYTTASRLPCPRLRRWPRTCDGCHRYYGKGCALGKMRYDAAGAEAQARRELSDSRRGIDMGKEEFAE